MLFHSYYNPGHLCGECREEDFGPVCCDTFNQTDNCPAVCGLIMLFSMQPYEASVLDVHVDLPRLTFLSDSISLSEAFSFLSGSSSPYTVELRTWTVSVEY